MWKPLLVRKYSLRVKPILRSFLKSNHRSNVNFQCAWLGKIAKVNTINQSQKKSDNDNNMDILGVRQIGTQVGVTNNIDIINLKADRDRTKIVGLRHMSSQDSSDQMKTIGKIFQPVQERSDDGTGNKVTVVGVGEVGMAAVFAMLTQGVTNNIVMVDSREDKLRGEMLDLQHGSAFMKDIKIQASTDYSLAAGSKICVVTAGERRRPGESRLDLTQRNTDVLKEIIPQLMQHIHADTILVISSNPVDVLTYVTWKISGLPKCRVIGSGTNLDSARFRYLLSEKLGIATSSCHGYIIGEHGDTSVPVWSGVNIAGVRLSEFSRKIGADSDPEYWAKTHEMVLNGALKVMGLKGYTSWAIGLSLAELARAIITNAHTVHAVSTYLKGEHGIQEEVFLSLPCVLGHSGVCDVIRQPLTDTERASLQKSAELMAKVQAGIIL